MLNEAINAGIKRCINYSYGLTERDFKNTDDVKNMLLKVKPNEIHLIDFCSKNKVEFYSYFTDTGSITVFSNDVYFEISNLVGDGKYRLFIIRECDEDVFSELNKMRMILNINGNVAISLYDYKVPPIKLNGDYNVYLKDGNFYFLEIN